MSLRVYEIFFSIQGESSRIGLPTIFIRLTGCPLRCGYCDTEYAFRGGNIMSEAQILDAIRAYPTKTVCVTGGEPLAQKPCYAFLTMLADAGYQVSLETSGALSIEEVDSRVLVVMDIKTPDSGEESKNLWSNLDHIKQQDEIKFVICSHQDYLWSVDVIKKYKLEDKANLMFSPSYGKVNPSEIAEWMLKDGLHARLQVQLHKVLWGEKQGV